MGTIAKTATMKLSRGPVSLGSVVVTSGVNLGMKEAEFSSFVYQSLRRHVRADWGELGPEDRELNDISHFSSREDRGRLFSMYIMPSDPDVKIYVITEADRSSTTILLPNEY